MKRGSEYAKRIKHLNQQMARKLGKPHIGEPTDPIHQLIVGILAENASETKAAALFKRISEQMVDLNELRVTPPMELAEFISGTLPQPREKAERIIRVLNEIRARQDALDLSFLKQRGRREAREFLETLDGVGLCAAASVVVHSLGGHAVPVDYLTIYVLRKHDMVDGTATQAEVQGFLERNVPAADSRTFALLLNRYVVAEGARVPVAKLPELLNLAPPELPKPRTATMAKPEPAMGKSDELGDLDNLELEVTSLGELDNADHEEKKVTQGAKSHGGNSPRKVRTSAPPPAAAKKSAKPAKTSKSKHAEAPARKRKG